MNKNENTSHTPPQSDAQARMYEERAEAYDALISAEDAHGLLQADLLARIEVADRRILDLGAGTGRIARWLAPSAKHVHLVDRAGPMLDVARARLAHDGLLDRVSFHCADARELPLPNSSVDAAVAGWVFGHFRHWMPAGWRDEVDRAVAEMERVVVPNGPLVVIETLGTGHRSPRSHHALDEYFAHLETEHGFTRTWIRTDYELGSVERAVEVMGEFFGAPLVEQIRREGWHRVPECTGVFHR